MHHYVSRLLTTWALNKIRYVGVFFLSFFFVLQEQTVQKYRPTIDTNILLKYIKRKKKLAGNHSCI